MSKLKVFRKDDDNDELEQKYGGGKKGKKSKESGNSSSYANAVDSNSDSLSSKTAFSISSGNTKNYESLNDDGIASQKKSKGAKFVPLLKDGGNQKTVRLPGRQECTCQASRHKLISNCTFCGRIVCDQEGAGPCLFCGELILSTEEQAILDRGGAAAKRLLEKYCVNPDDEWGTNTSLLGASKDLLKAVEAKDRLLDYSRNSAKRTTVFDDESDYFSMSNPWATVEEKRQMDERKKRLRNLRFRPPGDHKFTFDFAGRKVVEDNVDAEMMYANENADANFRIEDASGSTIVQSNVVNDAVSFFPEFLETQKRRPKAASGSLAYAGADTYAGRTRIQDRETQIVGDSGNCLSMHQPYASLLVRGIKRHEGRTWYSPHRGRLWIASAAKVSLREDIEAVEEFYRLFLQGQDIQFPVSYPNSCLLGCVDVIDCLPQEQYRELYPGGESESPYVLICENPRELQIRFPISGKHKIYELDPKIHQAAKRALKL